MKISLPLGWRHCPVCHFGQTGGRNRGGNVRGSRFAPRPIAPRFGPPVAAPRTKLFGARKDKYRYDLSAADPETQPYDDNGPALGLELGDYIERRTAYGQIIEDGIVLGVERAEANTYIFIDPAGQVNVTNLEQVVFRIPRLVEDRRLLRDAFAEYTHHRYPTKAARVATLLRQFLLQVDAARRELGLDFAEATYARLRSRFADRSRTLTLAQVHLSEPGSPIMDLAVHREISKLGMRFWLDERDHKVTRRYELRPLNDLDSYQRILEWCRNDPSVIERFAETIKRTSAQVAECRQHDTGPASCEKGPRFSQEETMILGMMQRSLVSKRKTQINDERTLARRILRWVSPTADLEDNVIEQFLRDIGVLSPWHTPLAVERAWELPHYSKDEGTFLSAPLVLKEVQTCLTQAVDTLASVRHDFGDLPVYIIDDDGASELDDGCSFESRHDGDWIHIHIADPTNVISPASEIAAQAKRQGATIYGLDQRLPMLPEKLVHEQLTLRGGTGPQRVVTTSIKIGSDGSILDYQIRAALVRNAITMTYEMADQTLKGETKAMEAVTSDMKPSPASCRDLKSLAGICKRLFARRFRNGLFFLSSSSSSVTVKGMEPFSLSFDAPTYWRGSPSAVFTTSERRTSPSREMVAELAIAVGTVTAQFATENQIPIIYRGQQIDPKALPRLDLLLSLRDESGAVNEKDALKAFASHEMDYGKLVLSTKPTAHAVMGIDNNGYTQATSPLRRYTDLVAHWQIKSALGHAHKPPFAEQDLNEMITEQLARSKLTSRYQSRQVRATTIYFLQKLIRERLNGDPEPLRLTATVIPQRKAQQQDRTWVSLPDYGLRALLTADPTRAYAPGMTFPVELGEITFAAQPTLGVSHVKSPL